MEHRVEYDYRLLASLLSRYCAKRKLQDPAITLGISPTAVGYHCKMERRPSKAILFGYIELLQVTEAVMIKGTDENLIANQIEEQRGFVCISKKKYHQTSTNEDHSVHLEDFLRPAPVDAGEAEAEHDGGYRIRQ